MHILVFGGGMQGLVIARNLVNRKEKPQVTVADIRNPDSLPDGVTFKELNVLDGDKVKAALNDVDTAVLAVPSQIAREALTNILKTGTACVDVCFTPEPPLDLADLAIANGACCFVDCGVAPGISHILAGRAYEELGGLDSIEIHVGGIPQSPPAVFHHAVYFNPEDLISEYVRPARARTKGIDIEPDPLEAEIKPFHDREMGELQSFISDGLRTLLTSFSDVPNMVERTLRREGHLKTMADLKSLGLFEEDIVSGTARALNNKFSSEDYPDFILMHVETRSKTGNKVKSWRMLDRATEEESSMARTTGYTTAAVAMVLARKEFTEPGVFPPEKLGKDADLTEIILKDLADHGVVVVEELAAVK